MLVEIIVVAGVVYTLVDTGLQVERFVSEGFEPQGEVEAWDGSLGDG